MRVSNLQRKRGSAWAGAWLAAGLLGVLVGSGCKEGSGHPDTGTALDGGPGDAPGDTGPSPDADAAPPGLDSSTPTADGKLPASGLAAKVASKLGRPPNFLIGMGNDLSSDYNHDNDGAYTLGVTLDLHYAYLVGLKGQGGWPDWNANGSFVNILTDSADKHGVVPMFTLYSMAAWGEANVSVLTNDSYMQAYWDGAKLLFERLAIFNKPAVVHFEPDFWAFAQQQSGGDPTKLAVKVKSLAPDCAGQPDTMVGMGNCLVALARKYAPKVVIGFHASRWAGSAAATAQYLNAIGSDQADLVVIETLDRDAGCFEAHVDPNCQRNDGPWYWDETNQSSPSFKEHLAWAQQIHQGCQKPLLWWQMPFGVPSSTPGGSPGKYRDNRVKYLFAHPDEFVAAGGLGAVFGTGAGNQTYITSDGGQFKSAVTTYLSKPSPLP